MATKVSQRELLRQKKIEKARKQRLTYIGIISGIAVLLLGIIFIPQLFKKNTIDPNQSGLSLGDPNAPLQVVNFSDFRCSHCRTFALESEPDFIKNYVDTGQVFLTFAPLTFMSEDSIDAAEAAYCAADQNSFWEYKDILYGAATSATAFTETNLVNYAKQLDLDEDAFVTCLSDNRHLSAIEDDAAYADSVGVTGTPSFYVNGKVVYSNELINAVESALGTQN